jgi:O-antigen/teichoic acid export membrane protein
VGVRVSGILFGILIRRILGPQLIGIWNVLDMLASYLQAVTLGLQYSTERLLPLHRQREERAEQDRIVRLVFSWNILETLVVAVATAVVLFFFADKYAAELRRALYFLPFLFAGQKLLSVYPMLLRSTKEFSAYASSNFLIAQLDWLLLAWAWFGGLQGVLMGSVLNTAIKVAYYRRIGLAQGLFSFRFRVDVPALRPHFPYAPRYALFKGLFVTIERIDSTLVAYLLGTTALGYYYLGYRLASTALEIPHAVVYVAYPHLMESLARRVGEARAFPGEFERFLRLTVFLVLPVVIPLAYFGSDFVVRQILPAFAPGIPAIKVLMLAIGVQALRQLYYRAFMAHEKVGSLAWASACYFPAFFAFFAGARLLEVEPLTAVAIAALLAHTGNLCILYVASRSWIYQEASNAYRRRAGLIVLSHFSLLLAIVGIDAISPGDMSGTLGHSVLELALKLALAAVAAGLFAYVGLGADRQAIAMSAWRAIGGKRET